MRTLALLLMAFSSITVAQTATVQSPDGNIKIIISDEQSTPSYSISFKNKTVINNSALGFEFKQHAPFSNSFKITKVQQQSTNTQWQQPWGERQTVVDQHNEVTVTFAKPQPQGGTYSVRFKAFDSGVGFRYEVPKQAGLNNIEITKELTEFAVNNSHTATAWWIPARGWNRYEYVYNTTPLNDAALVHTPFTFKNQDGVHISIHEAALVDYAAMVLNQRRPGVFQADLTPWS
ncbi:glycoside hydrolase family 97 N-terminal domain-containing protein, partial [Pseudoalteromonas nigrifaciens]